MIAPGASAVPSWLFRDLDGQPMGAAERAAPRDGLRPSSCSPGPSLQEIQGDGRVGYIEHKPGPWPLAAVHREEG